MKYVRKFIKRQNSTKAADINIPKEIAKIWEKVTYLELELQGDVLTVRPYQ